MRVLLHRLFQVLPLAPVLALLLSCVAYRVTDPDALMRLAVGRYMSENSLKPTHDPFTFAQPHAPWRNPEWLGDLALYTVFQHSSERHLQLTVVALACIGYAVAYFLALELGASATVVMSLQVCTIATTATRVSARNDIHILWLLPLSAWLSRRAACSNTACVTLALALWLWSQLHSSFVLGGPIVCAALLEQRGNRTVGLCSVLASLPFLPFLGLSGAATYLQLYDHLVNAPIYHTSISEWMSPLTSDGWLAVLPLHVTTLLGLLSLVYSRNRRRAMPLTLFFVGVMLAYSSRRFLPMLPCAIVPGMAAWLSEAVTGADRRVRSVCGLIVVLLYAGITLRSAQRRHVESVFDRRAGPERAIQYIGRTAPTRSRVFNAFDDGPWLMWLGRPDLRYFIDPRNQLGAQHLERYKMLAAQPAAVDADLALIPHRNKALIQQFDSNGDWKQTFSDAAYSVFARRRVR